MGGSPCTKWSIAQKSNRETEPKGEGWELFKNYLIAKEKFKPDLFLYENNKSASQTIKDKIGEELGVGKNEFVRLTHINSALVSAQNRQRFYVTNFGDIPQPEDRGIVLRDILDVWDLEMITHELKNIVPPKKNKRELVERVGDVGHYATQGYRVYSPEKKGITVAANSGGAGSHTGLYAVPVLTTSHDLDDKSSCVRATYYKTGTRNHEENFINRRGYEGVICELCSGTALIGTIENNGTYLNGKQPSQQYRVYSCDGKSVCQNTGGKNTNGIYAVPANDIVPLCVAERGRLNEQKKWVQQYEVRTDEKTNTITKVQKDNGVIIPVLKQLKNTYEVKNGLITVKGKSYPIKLSDGYYIIRKLTINECCRLQGMPTWWFKDDNGKSLISDTQAYKALGNGWQLDTVKYIIALGLNGVDRNTPIELLSLYDGISTARRILEELGFTNVTFVAYEIDENCIKVSQHRYPDVIQLGDVFDIRKLDWEERINNIFNEQGKFKN